MIQTKRNFLFSALCSLILKPLGLIPLCFCKVYDIVQLRTTVSERVAVHDGYVDVVFCGLSGLTGSPGDPSSPQKM